MDMAALVGVVFYGFWFCLAAWIVWAAVRSLIRASRGPYAPGTVRSHGLLETRRGSKGQSYRVVPVTIQFQPVGAAGAPVSFTEHVRADAVLPDYDLGAGVRVLYDPAAPARASAVRGAGWGGPVAALVLGLIIVLPMAVVGWLFAIDAGVLANRLGGDPFEHAAPLFLLAVGLPPFLIPALALTVSRPAFLRRAVAAEARVEKLEDKALPVALGDTRFKLAHLEFVAANRPVQRISVVRSAQDGYVAGQRFKVLYDPVNPKVWMRDGWRSRYLAPVVLWLVTAAVLAGAWGLQQLPTVAAPFDRDAVSDPMELE